MVWQPPGHIPGFHAPGTNAPGQWLVEQAALQAQAAQAAAQAAALARAEAELRKQAALNAAAAAFAATGVTCEQAPEEAPAQPCGRTGAGRCRHCQRSFCLDHRSANPVIKDLCDPCQRRQYEQAAQAAQAKREEAERANQRHAALLRERDTRFGWAKVRSRIAQLEMLLRSERPSSLPGNVKVICATLLLMATPILVVIAATAWPGIGREMGVDAVAALIRVSAGLVAIFCVPWAIRMLRNRSREKACVRYQGELLSLLTQLGCGTDGCTPCSDSQDARDVRAMRQNLHAAASRPAPGRRGAATPVRLIGLMVVWAVALVPVGYTRRYWAVIDEPIGRPAPGSEAGQQLLLHFGVSVIAAIVLIGIGIRITRRTLRSLDQ